MGAYGGVVGACGVGFQRKVAIGGIVGAGGVLG